MIGPDGCALPQVQAGALCWRMHRDQPEVLLITSRDTGRWIIPKGWPVAGLAPEGTAAREAWEEAGVEGTTCADPVGSFGYSKMLGAGLGLPCVVEVFALRVGRLADVYPEKGQRRRKWFSLKKAARKVQEPDLRRLILAFAPPAAG